MPSALIATAHAGTLVCWVKLLPPSVEIHKYALYSSAKMVLPSSERAKAFVWPEKYELLLIQVVPESVLT